MLAEWIVLALTQTEFKLDFPETVSYQGITLNGEDDWSQEARKRLGIGRHNNGTNSLSTDSAIGHRLGETKQIYYKILQAGEVVADLADFRTKVAETLNDERGWRNAGLEFKEVESGQDLNIILADAATLDAISGCSGDLSCTTWDNEVIINDLRWREGTATSQAAGVSERDYQHMVINHEVGHWLGHYSHLAGCTNGGPAPIMVQQSTGLRGCDSFNAWPLKEEWWTLR